MNQILDILERFYRKVSSSETFVHEYHNDFQKEKEGRVAYGSKLEL